MPRTISINLGSISSIRQGAAEIRAYSKWVEQKSRQLAEELSLIGIREASIRFANAMYDGVNDVQLSTEERAEGDTYVFTILAHGHAVCFIEFGAGVYHNTAAYPLPKPEGVVGIGEYGKGKGKQNYWGYYGDNPGSNGWVVETKKGPVVITHGNPAAMPMYYASSEMKQRILSIAKEVFQS